MERSRFVSHDGKEIELYVWDKVDKPKAVLKIAHGMAEHSARYDEFARYLNVKGYIVVLNDHRGHGYSAESGSLGYEEGDMFANNVHDQLKLLEYCKEKYKLPVFMMGHSYGSFVTQAVIENNPDVKGFVVCGSNFMKGITFTAGGIVARHLCKHKGGRFPAQTIVDLSFKQYEKKIPGKNNWLNRDEKGVELYNSDPMCGFTCSANFYRSFMSGIKTLYKKEYYSNIDASKPILIISGANDPVGEYGKGVRKLEKFYRSKVCAKDVTVKIYEGARHEILNENNRIEVFSDVAEWLRTHLAN